ncbi:hypothetical protein SANTM175S_08122 [Streptomyces antimycoticus]
MSTQPQQPEPVPEGAVTEPGQEQDLPAPGTAEVRGAGGEGPGPDAAGGPADTASGEASGGQAAALAELDDRWRRALADLENLRKRHTRELERERAASARGRRARRRCAPCWRPSWRANPGSPPRGPHRGERVRSPSGWPTCWMPQSGRRGA